MKPGHLLPDHMGPIIIDDPRGPGAALLIPRKDVEACDPGRLVALMQTHIASLQATRKYAGRLTVVVDGYNDDPRDVAGIPEIRRFYAAFESDWPFLPYFMEVHHGEYLLYLSLVCNGRRVFEGQEIVHDVSSPHVFKDADALRNCVGRFGTETCAMLASLGGTEEGGDFDHMKRVAEAMAAMFQSSKPLFRAVP